MSGMEFSDRLVEIVRRKGNPLCVGLDPHLRLLPPSLLRDHLRHDHDPWSSWAAAIETFFLRILDRIAPMIPVIKPQLAFFEQFGPAGLNAMQRIVREARERGVLVIADAKRGDIGTTAEAYANVFFSPAAGSEPALPPPVPCDACTLNPYLGSDSVLPFLNRDPACGVFILVRTSNASGGEFQELNTGDGQLMDAVARRVREWGESRVGRSGWSSVGAVVGANYPAEARRLRSIMPRTLFLIPGFGAQGGKADDAVTGLDTEGLGGIINSSRDILFAFRKEPYSSRFGEDAYDLAAEAACRDAIDIIRQALGRKS